MGQTLTGQVQVNLSQTYKNTLDLSEVKDGLSLSITNAFTDGTGSDKAQVVWHDERSLTTATSEELTLTGSLKNAFGTANFSKVKALVFWVTTSTSGYTLEIGGTASGNQFVGPFKDASDVVTVGAGGLCILSRPKDGWTVDATHKVLKVNNPSGGTLTYRVWVIGEGTVS